jgi:hypothetical protein
MGAHARLAAPMIPDDDQAARNPSTNHAISRHTMLALAS